MASPKTDLEQLLREAGNSLSQHPSSLDELLALLDKVEIILSRVEQSPPKSMLDALSPSMKALVEDKLFKHTNIDVKVAVASCLSEITRITAPDAPYDDEKMKDVFQLIVSSFENLSDQSSRSYDKRASILETVSKVRSCVVMLDLECDGLIVEMFQHFLNSVRDYHLDNIFSSMETIMTLVLEESEDITVEMLNPILASVKKNDEGVLPVSRRLGESVLGKSADKVRPYLIQALKHLGVSSDDYCEVVASICGGTTPAIEHNDENMSGQLLDDKIKSAKISSDEAAQGDEGKLTTASSEDMVQVVKETGREEPCLDELEPAADRSPKSVMSNGNMVAGNEETSVHQEPSKKAEQGQLADDEIDIKFTSKIDTDVSEAGKLAVSEPKAEETAKRRGRKSNAKLNSVEPSDSSYLDSEKEVEKLPDQRKSQSKDAHASADAGPSMQAAIPSENEKDSRVPSSPKEIESEAANAASSSPIECRPEESHAKKSGGSKKKQSAIQEDDAPTKASEETSDTEVKLQKRTGKKPAKATKQDKIFASVAPPKNEAVTTSDSEAKMLKQSGKKVDAVDSGAKPGKKSSKKVDAGAEAKLLKNTVKKVDAAEAEAKPLKVKKGDVSDSEAKPQRQSGKKGDVGGSEKTPKQAVKKGEESDSDAELLKQSSKRGSIRNSRDENESDAKPPVQSAKRGKLRNSGEDKSSSKKEQGRGKSVAEKDEAKSVGEDDEILTPPRSAAKSAKDEEEDRLTNSKRKRTAGKEKETGPIKYGENLVGSKVKVWWPKDRMYYEGVIESFDPVKMKHKVIYTDGDQEILNLKNQKWEFMQDGSQHSEQDEVIEDQCLDDSSETRKKKKAKTDSGPSPPQGKMESSSKRGGASSSKLKSTTSKSGGKSNDKDAGKHGNKSKDSTSKSTAKQVDDDDGGKSKDKTLKSSVKSGDGGVTPKAAGKSKEDVATTPKTTNKAKKDTNTTAKTVGKSKGKSGNKSNANGSSKGKSSSSDVKEKEAEEDKGDSPDEQVKAKPESGGAKGGKKRKKRS